MFERAQENFEKTEAENRLAKAMPEESVSDEFHTQNEVQALLNEKYKNYQDVTGSESGKKLEEMAKDKATEDLASGDSIPLAYEGYDYLAVYFKIQVKEPKTNEDETFEPAKFKDEWKVLKGEKQEVTYEKTDINEVVARYLANYEEIDADSPDAEEVLTKVEKNLKGAMPQIQGWKFPDGEKTYLVYRDEEGTRFFKADRK